MIFFSLSEKGLLPSDFFVEAILNEWVAVAKHMSGPYSEMKYVTMKMTKYKQKNNNFILDYSTNYKLFLCVCV